MKGLTALLGIIINTPVARACALLAVGLLLAACAPARPPAVLTEQVKSARTSDEHRAVAAGYREYSQRLRADAAQHANLAEWWSNLPDGGWEEGRRARDRRASRDQEAQHCRALADSLSKAAAAAEAIADAHEQSARSGSGDR